MTTKLSSAPPQAKSIPSDAELMALPHDGCKYELLNGEIVMAPAGFGHGWNIALLTAPLGLHVSRHRLGAVLDGQTGFRMKSRDVLSPDISFVSRARLPASEEAGKKFFEGAPDLAIEYLSPDESLKRMSEKVSQYLSNGCRLTWVLDSRSRTVAVYRPSVPHIFLTETEDLSAEDVVPGFSIRIASLFADW